MSIYPQYIQKQRFSAAICNWAEKSESRQQGIITKRINSSMHGYKNALKGRYTPKNPQKYIGDVNNIIYRSSLERRCMYRFDTEDMFLKWNSESVVIPYISPIDQKCHMYHVDFLVKARRPDGTTVTRLIEVKPEYQCKEPIKQKKVTKKYLTEVMTWGINQAKWKSATEYALDQGWTFVILTEKNIFPNRNR